MVRIGHFLNLVIIALILIVFPQQLFGQNYNTAPSSRDVQIIGVGTVFNNDVAAARDRALDDALRKAVEQTMGTFIDATTKVENYMVVEDRILNWSRGYVSNYQILSEFKKSPELYEVQIQATVDMSNLQKDSQAVVNLIHNFGNPVL